MGWIPWAAACWLAGLAAALSGWNREIALCAAAVLGIACGLAAARRAWRVAVVYLAFFALAAAYGMWHRERNSSRLPEGGYAVLTGVLASQPEIDGDRVRFVLRTADRERVAVTVRLAGREELGEAGSWRRGDEARLYGELALPRGPRNFGQFDYAAWLAKRGIHRVFTVDGAEHATVRRPERIGPGIALGWLESVRAGLGRRIAELYPGAQSGFMQAMLIGLEGEMDEELFNAFSRLGMTHVIAISGLHVGVVTGGWILLLRLFRVSREAALNSIFAVIPAYVLLAGAAPSVIRAGLMAMLGTFALRRGWRKDAMRFVALAAVAMTAWNPSYLHDIGFQLSFAVTAGLIAGTPVAMRLLPAGWPKWLSGSAAVAVTAQAVSFPLTIHYFNQYSLLSGIANFLLVPVFSLAVLPFGYVSLIVSFASESFGRRLAAVPGWLNEWGFWLIERGSRIEGAGTVWPSPPVWALLLYYLLLAGVCAGAIRWRSGDRDLFPARSRAGRSAAIVCTGCLALWCAFVWWSAEWEQRGTVSFLDVGQGDAILIRTPEGKTILVDGGGTIRFRRPGEEWRDGRDPYEVGKDLLVPLMKKRAVRRIDIMIVTHGDADHAGGLSAVAEAIPTRRIVFNGTVADSEPFRKLAAVALERNIPLIPAEAGRSMDVDRHTRLDMLYPLPRERLSLEKNQNTFSVVFLLTMHGKRLLFTGDMDAAAERETVRLLRLAESEAAAKGGTAEVSAAAPDAKAGKAAKEEETPMAADGEAAVLHAPMRAEGKAAAGEQAAVEGLVSFVAGESSGRPVNVMKIAHHGSKSSTSELWLNRWKPELAVISVGERNAYGHPGKEVLARLERRGIPVFRTDLHGEIQMKIRSGEIVMRTFLAPRQGGHE